VTLKQIIEQDDTPAGRAFDLFIQALIVLSLVSFSIGTLPDLGPGTRRVLAAIELVCIAVFSLEYVVRTAVATHRLRFTFSFFGLIDLAAILPFYLASGLDLRSLRAFRLLRLFRAVKLLRYSRAALRFKRALVIVREELVLFGCLALIVLYLSAVGVYYFEHVAQPDAFLSFFDGLWWAVVTLTTVDYGDVYPVTVGGHIFMFVVLIIGLGVVAVPTGLLASALSRAREERGRFGGLARSADTSRDTTVKPSVAVAQLIAHAGST
jgi:voltage-gated potassium channel